MNKPQYNYLNLLKFIAIIMVCSYHFSFAGNLNYSNNIQFSTSIKIFLFNLNSMCIPLFFLVNGALILNKNLNLNSFIKRNIKLILQFFIWRIITIISIAYVTNLNLLEYGKKPLFNAILFGKFPGIDLAHFWFIPELIGVYILLPLVKKEYENWNESNTKNNYIPILLFILFVFGFLINDINTISKLFSFSKGIEFYNIQIFNPFVRLISTMLFYFIIGGYLHKNLETIQKIKTWQFLLIFFTGSLMLFTKWYIESKTTGFNFDGVFGGYNSISCILLSISTFALTYKLSLKYIENKKYIIKLLKIIGSNTLNVYYLHWIFGYTILSTFSMYLNFNGIVTNLIKAIFMVLTFSFIGQILKKIPLIRSISH